MKRIVVSMLVIACCPVCLFAHDTFLKFETYHLQPQKKTSVSLMNGTIEKSENSVAVDRLKDVRIVGPQKRIQHLENSQWMLTETLSTLGFATGDAGTYVAGVSIKPRNLEMSSADFDKYLLHSGVKDILKQRRKKTQTGEKVVEKYSKHVKAVFQVGEKRTNSFRQSFDYPIEIIPQENPLAKGVGDVLPVKIFLRGKPLPNQLVYASYVGFHKHDDDGQHVEAVQTRTDVNGEAEIKITKNGIWYIRLIHMAKCQEDGVDFESNWATITFEIK
jgi:uncharacterized GH25 family protein